MMLVHWIRGEPLAASPLQPVVMARVETEKE